MGRLNFTKHYVLEQQGRDAAIVNLPDNSLQQILFRDGAAYTCSGTIPSDYNYDNVSFGTERSLPYTDVRACSIKSFPHFGSYGYITQFAGQRISMLITNF